MILPLVPVIRLSILACSFFTFTLSIDLRPVFARDVMTTVLKATPSDRAVEQARLGKGRADPFSPLPSVKPFPVIHVEAKLESKTTKIPPPPTSEHFQVPPPPLPPSADAIAHLSNSANVSFSDLPYPPEKPNMADKLKLVGIIGDSAIFTFNDLEYRRSHKYPRTLLLGSGEGFESVNLARVDRHEVTLEEDGAHTKKTLPRIGMKN